MSGADNATYTVLTELIDKTIGDTYKAGVEATITDAISKANGDWEQVARGLAYALGKMAYRYELCAGILSAGLTPEPQKPRGRPRTKPHKGLYIPHKYRTKRKSPGAPKKYALPKPMKWHALEALARWEHSPAEITTAKEAAIVELERHGVAPDPAPVRNLQKRISDLKRQLGSTVKEAGRVADTTSKFP